VRVYVSRTYIYGNLSIKHNYRRCRRRDFSSHRASARVTAIDLIQCGVCCIDTRIIYGNLYRNKSQILQWHHSQRELYVIVCVLYRWHEPIYDLLFNVVHVRRMYNAARISSGCHSNEAALARQWALFLCAVMW
jgi:hypothetical protein